MNGATTEQYNDILKGLENAQNKAGLPLVKMPNIGWAPKTTKYAGYADNDGIWMRETFVKRTEKEIATNYAQHTNTFNNARQVNIKIATERLAQMKKGSYSAKSIIDAEKLLNEAVATTKYTVSSSAGTTNVINGVVSHEYGHIVYREKKLETIFLKNTKAIPKIDKMAVSQYGTKSTSELFSEVVSALSIDRGADIPPAILSAYRETIKEIVK